MQTSTAEEINKINNDFSLIRTLSKVITELNGGCFPDLNEKEFGYLIFIQQAQIENLHNNMSKLIDRLGI